MMNKQIKRLLSDTAIFAVGNASSKIILFILLPLYTTYMTTAEYGVSDTLTTLVELIFPVATLAVADAVFRFSIEPDINRGQLFKLGSLFVLSGMMATGVGCAIAGYFFRYPYALYLWLMIVSYSYKQFIGCFLRGVGKTKIFAISGIVTTAALAICNLILLTKFKLGIHGYLLSVILSNFIGILIMIAGSNIKSIIKQDQSFHVRKDLRLLCTKLLRYGLPIVPNSVSWWINNAFGKYAILWFYGASMAGIFSAASKLPSIINLASSIFQQAWQYSSAKEFSSKNRNAFFSKTFQLYSSFILCVCSAAIAGCPIICKIVLKNNFSVALTYIPLLLLSATFGCYSVFWGGFYTAAKKNSMLMISTLIGALVNLVFTLLLIKPFAIMGVVIANNVSYMVIVCIRAIDTRKYVQLSCPISITILSLFFITVQAIIATTDGDQHWLLQLGLLFLICLMNLRSIFRRSNRPA